ncbi:hypothetical protein DL98DRAFT_510892 [Cadophora sp. DSE1049]|nr:hypothetical protein DL98DRAFT_510892 [Cadophora sp. DSE1049]
MFSELTSLVISERSDQIEVHATSSTVSCSTTSQQQPANLDVIHYSSLEQGTGFSNLAYRLPCLSTRNGFHEVGFEFLDPGLEKCLHVDLNKKNTSADPSHRVLDNNIDIEGSLEVHLSYKPAGSQLRPYRQSVTSSLLSTAGGTSLKDFEYREVMVAGCCDIRFGFDATMGDSDQRGVVFDVGDQDIALLGVGAQFGDVGHKAKHAVI